MEHASKLMQAQWIADQPGLFLMISEKHDRFCFQISLLLSSML